MQQSDDSATRTRNRTAVSRGVYLVMTVSTLLGVAHHVDHVVRGNHVGWPVTSHVNPLHVQSRHLPARRGRALSDGDRPHRQPLLGGVRADDPEPVVAAIRSHPDISEYEALWTGDGRAIAQYEAVEQGLYEFLWASSLPPEFPIVVEDGVMEFDLTTTREGFEAFGDALDAGEQEYELLSVVHETDDGALLTERQRECVTAAFRLGYFEVPRGATLAEVANELDIDKSTASETIRRAAGRVMAQFLLGGESV